MKFHTKSKLTLLVLLLLFFPLLSLKISCEKWVGQAATYQLIEGKKILIIDEYDVCKDNFPQLLESLRFFVSGLKVIYYSIHQLKYLSMHYDLHVKTHEAVLAFDAEGEAPSEAPAAPIAPQVSTAPKLLVRTERPEIDDSCHETETRLSRRPIQQLRRNARIWTLI